MEVLIAAGPDGAAIRTPSAVKERGREVELGEEGVGEEEGKTGIEERCKGWVGVGERENN